MITLATVLVTPLLMSGCSSGNYVVTNDVSYDGATGLYGMFDMYEPTSDSTRVNRPAILAIHGGAWKGGDKAWGDSFAAEFCPYGYVVFSVNYRLSEDHQWPTQIRDVQSALRYIRANAVRFRIDPSRIASLGMSAGGHLATMVALRDDSVNADGRLNVAVNLDGEHDLTMSPDKVMSDYDLIMTKVLGHSAPWSVEELRDISTVTYARPDVSVLTIHAAGDDNVYVAQGERITEALKAAGAETEFMRIDGKLGKCHEDCWKVPEARLALHRYLDRKLTHDGNTFFEKRTGAKSPFAN